MFYVIPSVIIGIILSIPVLTFISNILEPTLGTKFPTNPTTNAIIYALVVGALIPLFSSIFPIRNALG